MDSTLAGTAPVTAAKRRRWIGVVIASLVVVALVAVLVPRLAGGASKAEAEAKARQVVPLEFTAAEIARPTLAKLPLVVEFSGPLVAPRTAIVRAKATGTLLALRVAEGSRVQAGQSIGEIDTTDLQSRVADRAALVESSEASLLEAERQHAANVGLAAQNFISTTALQSSQARLDAARAQLKSTQAQLATSRVGVREASLTAPIGGIVGKRWVVPGEKVSAEQQLITVVDLSTLEVAATVGTNEVSLLRPGQAVSVQVEGEREAVPGRIDRIAPAAEAGTRAIGVVVVLDNRGERYRAGQYARARVELVDETPRLSVPTSAIGQASGQDFVWTIEKEALVRRIVVAGRTDAASGRTEVKEGLTAEAQVLAARFENLKEGAPAKIVARRTATAASAAASSSPQSSPSSAAAKA